MSITAMLVDRGRFSSENPGLALFLVYGGARSDRLRCRNT